MNDPVARAAQLRFLARVIRRELGHLQNTDARLFVHPMTADVVAKFDQDADLAERVEAFVGRFGRLQDTLGDKLLPKLLAFVGERPATMMDNLDRAERLGWIGSSDTWLALRMIRNRMVHEYIEDPYILADALNSGHAGVEYLAGAASNMLAELERRLGNQ